MEGREAEIIMNNGYIKRYFHAMLCCFYAGKRSKKKRGRRDEDVVGWW